VPQIRYGCLQSKHQEDLCVKDSVPLPTEYTSGATLGLRFGTVPYRVSIRRNFVPQIRYGCLLSKHQEELCVSDLVRVPTE
jgi:hypothetical protein